MFLDKNNAWKRFNALWNDANIRSLETKNKRIAILSDMHLGNGGDADDFHTNQQALVNALDYYHKEGYTIILLGDIEEFWQFDLFSIKDRYDRAIYSRLRKFDDGHIFRIFGNHDYEWGGFRDPIRNSHELPGIADEAIKLQDGEGVDRILLVHGHQGTIESDKFSWFSRFFVRIFRSIEPITRLTGLYPVPSSTKSMIAKDFERTLYQWALDRKVLLFCGHTHRAIFASKSFGERLNEDIAALKVENTRIDLTEQQKRENLRTMVEKERQLEDEKEKGRVIEPIDPGGNPKPCYFNTGCGLYSDGITALDIEDGHVRLVKWERDTIRRPYFKVYQEGDLNNFIADVLI